MFSSLRDIRIAFRALTRSPWFTTLAVATLSLGIGANTALFSLLDAVLLRALPYKDPDRLVEIWGQNGKRTGMRVPEPFLEALRARAATIEAIAIHGPAGGVLRTREGATQVFGDRVSSNFVEVMGVPPLAGRGFLAAEAASAEMLVSYNFWRRHLGGAPEAVGLTVYMDGVPYTVVGIMPREFRAGFGRNSGKEYWTTYVSEQTRKFEREAGYELVARLSAGATLEESRREMSAIAASVEVKGWGYDSRSLGMVPLKEEVVGDSAYALKLLLAAVAVVLAIGCANLAQLLLARSEGRIGEFATRKAIGAPVSQLFRLALMESLLLSVAGGVGGIALAYWLLPLILTLAPSEIPRIAEASIDGRVLAAAVGLSLLTGGTFGLAPAWRLSRVSVAQALARDLGRFSSPSTSFRSALLVGQVAGSVALFVLAGLLGRTLVSLLPSSPGFEAKGRTVFPLFLTSKMYPNLSDRSRLLHGLLQRLEAIPGITEAGVSSNIPFSGDHGDAPVRDIDHAGAAAAKADTRAISPNYFRLLQMPLVRGRVFTANDGPQAHGVAIVNERLARSLVPGGDVLGRRVRIGASAAQPPYQIVGVVADARSTGTSVNVLNEIYIPYAQRAGFINYLIVRSSLDKGTLASALGREIRRAAPELPLSDRQTAIPMEELVSRSLAAPRFSALLISAFSATALLLSAMGVFGLVAYSVSRRRREFGIRAALGAGSRDLTVSAIRSAVVLTVVGVAFGLAAAAYATRFVESQLYAIKPYDLPTFIGAAAVMVVVAGLAAYIPAKNAVRADPMTALRYE